MPYTEVLIDTNLKFYENLEWSLFAICFLYEVVSKPSSKLKLGGDWLCAELMALAP